MSRHEKCFSSRNFSQLEMLLHGQEPRQNRHLLVENIDWNNHKVFYPTARKAMNKELWDYLAYCIKSCPGV